MENRSFTKTNTETDQTRKQIIYIINMSYRFQNSSNTKTDHILKQIIYILKKIIY